MKLDGPVYPIADVLALAEETSVVMWTRRCIQTVRDLYEGVRDEYDSEMAMLVDLLKRVPAGRYQDSEWCDNGRGGLAACDAYEVNRDDMIPAIGKRMQTRYFVKFAIGKTGQLLLVVSCHV
jgi:hypothetical protein